MATKATKAEQIIDHFTNDPVLKTKILASIQQSKGKGVNVAHILANFNLDPGTTATVHKVIAMMTAGHSPHSVTASLHPNPTTASNAAQLISEHTGTVRYILQSK
jgi:hypothetical protein